MKKIIATLLFLLAAGGVIFIVLYPQLKKQKSVQDVKSFEECAAAGYPVMESYPRQCAAPNGRYFVENLMPEK